MFTWSLACDAFAGQRGEDLVGVHVRRGARAGLEDVDRELVVVVARGHLVAARARSHRRAWGRACRGRRSPRAAAPLMRPSQWMTDGGTVSPEMGKLSTAFFVSPP